MRQEAGAIGSGVPAEDVLDAFAAAICSNDPAAVARAREQVVGALGLAAMIDAAAVIAAFNAYPRVADATGIPLEPAKEEGTRALREALGLDRLRAQ